MFDIKTKENELVFAFSSKLEMVDRLLLVAMDFLEELQDEGNPKYFKVILRELLCNAIEHGNRLDVSKVVEGSIKMLSSGRFVITATDEGEGIDDSILSFEHAPDEERGRSMGFVIINTYCDEIRFDKENKTVKVYVTLPKETLFETEVIADKLIISPSGDISASVSEAFRDTLIEWIDNKELQECNIDFSNVGSIDSVSLGVLVSFYRLKSSSEDNRKVIFFNVCASLMDVFRLTQLHKMYEFESES